jgi:segregation and condensation protein B
MGDSGSRRDDRNCPPKWLDFVTPNPVVRRNELGHHGPQLLSFAAMRPRKSATPAKVASAEAGTAPTAGGESPLSLHRLREAFAVMLGEHGPRGTEQRATSSEQKTEDARAELPVPRPPLPATCEINPRSVVEAMLFVGRPADTPYTARELAAAMRGVSPAEIEETIADLNATYAADGAAYCITASPSGYRLSLRTDFERVRDKFYGKVREAKLSSAALEVLSVLAYNQPATVDQVNELRGASSSAALATLVRRRLVRLDRAEGTAEPPQYSTTERFLKLFGLDSLEALPRSEELEKI